MSSVNPYARYRFETWQEYEARRSRHLFYCLAMTLFCGWFALIIVLSWVLR